ncbi:MAG: hypothetical protein ACO1QS_01400 [Verrucomicrobiota bacterium]
MNDLVGDFSGGGLRFNEKVEIEFCGEAEGGAFGADLREQMAEDVVDLVLGSGGCGDAH